MKDSNTDKAEGTIDKIKGKAKEVFGKATGDRETEAEGKNDTTKGHAKETKGKVKDTVKSLTELTKKQPTGCFFFTWIFCPPGRRLSGPVSRYTLDLFELDPCWNGW